MIGASRVELARFFSRVEITPTCWLWRGAVNYKGYGVYRSTSAHRFAFSWFVAPIPSGYQVDHLCRVRDCVNPAHLEAVTGMENRLRGTGYPYRFGSCKRGHDLAAVGLAPNASNGEVICRECRRIAQARYASKRGLPLGEVLAGALMREQLRLNRHSRSPKVAA